MPALKYTLVIEQGATFRRKVIWKDKTGALINLTGARVEFQVRETRVSPLTLIDFDSNMLTAGQSLGHALDATGIIHVVLSDTITSALNFTAGVWDMFVTIAGGERDKLFYGTSALKSAVTRV